MLEHKHLIIRAEIAKPPKEEAWVESWFNDLIVKIGMKPLMGPYAKYLDVPGNRGLTSVCIIETSHMAMHIWDEKDPALMQLDVYTCGSLKIKDIIDELEQFEPTKIEFKFLDREHGLVEVLAG